MNLRYSERMGQIKSSFIRDGLKFTQLPGMISFAGGMPAAELFPVEAYRKAADLVLQESGQSALQYDTTEGYPPLRRMIAEELMDQVGVQGITEENIAITNGSQQGIDFSGRLFLDPGDVVLCENPTYIGALNAFMAYQPRFVQIPMDSDGMRMDALEKALGTTPRAKLIYTIPDFQNPTGLTLSLERRKQMVEIAKQYNVPIIEDNPYQRLRFTGRMLPAIKSFDTTGIVVYLGSFSKIFSPGIRIGWVCADETILNKYITVKQGADLHSSTIAQRELVKLMETFSINEHIQHLNQVYRIREELMLERIASDFPDGFQVTRPEGGFFLWATFPEKINTLSIYQTAIQEKVLFVPGATFYAHEDEKNHMRLSFSNTNEEKIVEGVKRLGKLLHTVLPT